MTSSELWKESNPAAKQKTTDLPQLNCASLSICRTETEVLTHLNASSALLPGALIIISDLHQLLTVPDSPSRSSTFPAVPHTLAHKQIPAFTSGAESLRLCVCSRTHVNLMNASHDIYEKFDLMIMKQSKPLCCV